MNPNVSRQFRTITGLDRTAAKKAAKQSPAKKAAKKSPAKKAAKKSAKKKKK